jgi:hypothetical protein
VPDSVINLVAAVRIPALGIEPGDIVRYRPRGGSHHWTIVKQRDLDMGSVLHAMNEGQLVPLDIMPDGVLQPHPAGAEGSAPPPPADAPPRPALKLHRQG